MRQTFIGGKRLVWQGQLNERRNRGGTAVTLDCPSRSAMDRAGHRAGQLVGRSLCGTRDQDRDQVKAEISSGFEQEQGTAERSRQALRCDSPYLSGSLSFALPSSQQNPRRLAFCSLHLVLADSTDRPTKAMEAASLPPCSQSAQSITCPQPV